MKSCFASVKLFKGNVVNIGNPVGGVKAKPARTSYKTYDHDCLSHTLDSQLIMLNPVSSSLCYRWFGFLNFDLVIGLIWNISYH